jgi:hypothetical protein
MQYNQLVVYFSVAKKSPHHENALPGTIPGATTCNTRHGEHFFSNYNKWLYGLKEHIEGMAKSSVPVGTT